MPSRTGRGSGNCNFVLVAPQSPEERHPEEYCNCIIMRPGCGVLRDEGRERSFGPQAREQRQVFLPTSRVSPLILSAANFAGDYEAASPKRRIADVSPPIP